MYIYKQNSLRYQNCKNEKTETKSLWYDWLIRYIPETLKKRLVVLKTRT